MPFINKSLIVYTVVNPDEKVYNNKCKPKIEKLDPDEILIHGQAILNFAIISLIVNSRLEYFGSDVIQEYNKQW